MSDDDRIQEVDLGDGRQFEGGDYSVSGRFLLDEPLESPSYCVGRRPLEKAAEAMGRAPEYYRPVLVELHRHDAEGPDTAVTLAFVNQDHPDDVIVIAPRIPVGEMP